MPESCNTQVAHLLTSFAYSRFGRVLLHPSNYGLNQSINQSINHPNQLRKAEKEVPSSANLTLKDFEKV